MSKIFSLTPIEGRNNKKKVIFQNLLQKLNFDKTFEDIIKSDIGCHGNGSAIVGIPPPLLKESLGGEGGGGIKFFARKGDKPVKVRLM